VTQTLETLKRLSSGIPGLDTVLNGGFFKGGLYLIQGTPGTGKTTIANQICFNCVANGDRALYVTLLAEYHARMTQYIGRMSFFDESKIPDQLSYLSGFRAIRSEGLPALLTLIRREILNRKASVLIVDGLVAVQRIAADDQAFNEFTHELQGIALATDCTIFLVASADRSHHSTPEHTIVDGILELSDQAFGWATERALQVTKIRGSGYLRGKHTYKITDDGIVVYPRIEALLAQPTLADHAQTGRVSSGCAPLDTMLGGGLPAGSPTMLAGPSGVGKTTFGLHFLCGCSKDEPGLMFGFYETPARIIAKAQQVCRPLVSLLGGGIVKMLWEPPTSDSIDAYAERLLTSIRKGGVCRLFLDGLGAFQETPEGEQRLRQYLPALTNELRSLGVTTIYSLEAGNIIGAPAPFSFGDLSVLAENLVLLRYVESGATLHRLISILKVRDSDFDPRLHEFVLTDNGPEITSSTQSAEAIMSGVVSREAKSGAAPASPRVE
jgi:circadian clock protein KaiC